MKIRPGNRITEMQKTVLFIFFMTAILGSCSKEELNPEADSPLLGVWLYKDYQDNTDIYTRGQTFTDNHCYNFKSDGSLIERKNAGWCGTPPISYSDYKGTWNKVNDTIILVNVGYWNGSISYYLDIEEVNSESLKFISIPVNN
jgi:hypothetical protein